MQVTYCDFNNQGKELKRGRVNSKQGASKVYSMAEEDFMVRRGQLSESLADQHLTAMEYDKSKRFYEEAYKYFKKGGYIDHANRVKKKYAECVKKINGS